MADAHIVLAYSRGLGIVAMAHGTKYELAHAALSESGFQRSPSGVHRIPIEDPDTSRAYVADLVRCAEDNGVTVTTSSRRFIGDTARDIARLLPGQWQPCVELYCHPVWQEDLVSFTWGSGELGHAVQTERIPYAATLTEPASGTTLLLVERPGHPHGYLVGALDTELSDEAYAPSSVVLPPSPAHAARTIANRYLPAYDRAVHARRITAVDAALAHIRIELEAWTPMLAEVWRRSTGPPDDEALDEAIAPLLDDAWGAFLTVMDHAPALLTRCRHTTPGPDGTEPLARLATALSDAETVREDLARNSGLTGTERITRTLPPIETWLTHGDLFLRQARAASPPQRSARAVPAPVRALPQSDPHPAPDLDRHR